jgi:hypothetical protein
VNPPWTELLLAGLRDAGADQRALLDVLGVEGA